jgi:hypothetical protein
MTVIKRSIEHKVDSHGCTSDIITNDPTNNLKVITLKSHNDTSIKSGTKMIWIMFAKNVPIKQW